MQRESHTYNVNLRFFQIDKDAIKAAAMGDNSLPVAEWCCDWKKYYNQVPVNSTTNVTENVFSNKTCVEKCKYLTLLEPM